MIFSSIKEQLAASDATLVAVSKTHSNEKILQLYEQEQRDFGENKVQELDEKYNTLPKDIRWHFIGHLQTNKVKYIAPYVHLIHSIDSAKIIREINKRALQNDRQIKGLLQFKIAKEDSKYGLTLAEGKVILDDLEHIKGVKIVGVMGMATFTDNQDQVRQEFQRLQSIFVQLKESYFPEDDHFKEISMGMSGDYAIALEEGSTMVRIGSLLFGNRSY